MAKGLEVVLLLRLTVTVLVCMAAPGCRSACGDVQTPYTFGTEQVCHYRDDLFLVTFSKTSSSGHPMTNYSLGNIPVLSIPLDDEMRISYPVWQDCFSGQNNTGLFKWSWFRDFAISNTKNKFTVVGCDNFSDLTEWHNRFSTGCSLICRNIADVVNGCCSGIGCCETTFPKDVKAYNITLYSYYNHTYVQDFNPCGYAFLVEDGFYNFTIQLKKTYETKPNFL